MNTQKNYTPIAFKGRKAIIDQTIIDRLHKQAADRFNYDGGYDGETINNSESGYLYSDREIEIEVDVDIKVTHSSFRPRTWEDPAESTLRVWAQLDPTTLSVTGAISGYEIVGDVSGEEFEYN